MVVPCLKVAVCCGWYWLAHVQNGVIFMFCYEVCWSNYIIPVCCVMFILIKVWVFCYQLLSYCILRYSFPWLSEFLLPLHVEQCFPTFLTSRYPWPRSSYLTVPLEENIYFFKLVYFLIISYLRDITVYCCRVCIYSLINDVKMNVI